MTYKQLKIPNLNTKGKVGFCLQYARNVFGIGAKYPTAWVAWQSSKQHKNRNYPKDVAIFLWFSFYQNKVNFGHVVVAVPKKGLYSSPWKQGTTHAVLQSISEVERIYGAKYVGWSTDANGVEVAKPVIIEDMYKAKFNGKEYNKTAKQWYQVAITHLKKEKALETALAKCKKSGPESNDQAVKDSLFNKIKGVFGK